MSMHLIISQKEIALILLLWEIEYNNFRQIFFIYFYFNQLKIYREISFDDRGSIWFIATDEYVHNYF